MARFLFTTFGSLGDLHPYIAVGCGLAARGHTVIIGTSPSYRRKIEGEGLRFRPLGPDLSLIQQDPEIMRRAMHPARGTEYVFRELVLPHIEALYEDTALAARDVDLIVGHSIAFATPIVAEVLKKRWISVALQPSAMISAHDPIVVPGLPQFLRAFGPAFWNPFFRFVRRVLRRWGEPVNRLRKSVGLPPALNPVLDDMYSPYGTQAWFSRVLAGPQPDWPPGVAITGFPFYDREAPGAGLPEGLLEFLASGAPPVVFTLGSSAIHVAGSFYRESAEAAKRIGVRAVLLTGRVERNRLPERLPASAFVAEYAPYSALLPCAAATVHQGGIGTTAQALRSGRPMIVVPFSHDQPDNAMRVSRLGVSRTISRSKYRAELVARELETLLGDVRYREKAKQAAEAIAAEDGVQAAGDGLEACAAQAS